MGRIVKIQEETYNKLARYAAEKGTTKSGAVSILATDALRGEKKFDSAEAMERLEAIEKKLDKLILLEMEK